MEDIGLLNAFNLSRSQVDEGEYATAFNGSKALLEFIESQPEKRPYHYHILFNIAGNFTDIGALQPNKEASQIGLALMEKYEKEMLSCVDAPSFYYNFANAKSNLVEETDSFQGIFYSIEQLVEVKAYFWKSLVTAMRKGDGASFEQRINLGNILKRQFRLVEALKYYDQALVCGLDYPQAWINRSDALMSLNRISGQFSISMLKRVREGYLNSANSPQTPKEWISHLLDRAYFLEERILSLCDELDISEDDEDDAHTQSEYRELGRYRKFCLDKHLSLSEHGLYCKCIGSSRDNLVITTSTGLPGDYIPRMEGVLNRIKSEYCFARSLYFDYLNNPADVEFDHDSHFSDIHANEILGTEAERIRTAFKLCFGILDKIAVAVCELFDLSPKGPIYFHNLWNYCEEKIKSDKPDVRNHGLIALCSIATDIDNSKRGELLFFKKLRNALEHNFVVIYKGDTLLNPPPFERASDGFMAVSESEFMDHLELVLGVARSAIFSFVFTVRKKARDEDESDGIRIPYSIGPRSYL